MCAFDKEDDSDANDRDDVDDDGGNSMCNSLKFGFLYLNTFLNFVVMVSFCLQ